MHISSHFDDDDPEPVSFGPNIVSDDELDSDDEAEDMQDEDFTPRDSPLQTDFDLNGPDSSDAPTVIEDEERCPPAGRISGVALVALPPGARFIQEDPLSCRNGDSSKTPLDLQDPTMHQLLVW
jgi:hypothetical protein